MAEAYKLWARTMRGQRMLGNETADCDPEAPQQALQELCRRMDIPRPLWLGKHQKEYDAFRRTSFSQDHFMEHIAFSRLEIELILPDDQGGAKRRGPRTPLLDA